MNFGARLAVLMASSIMANQLVQAASAQGDDKQKIKEVVVAERANARVGDVRSISSNGETFYEVEFREDGRDYEAIVSESGVITSINQEKYSQLIIGAGVSYETDFYKDQKAGFGPMPLIYGELGRLWFRGTKIGFDVYKGNYFTISPIFEPNLDGYDANSVKNNSSLYDGLADRGTAFDLGAEISFDAGWADISLAGQYDISGKSKGTTVDFRVAKNFHLTESFMVIPALNATWSDKKFNQYYYGVDKEFETDFRAAYQAKSGVSFEGSVVGVWDVTDRWKVLGRVAYNSYTNAVKDSPLVDKSGQFSAAFGIGYAF
ncbi:MAG: MipA/OmpV family protein [Kordiimonas sp.]